MARTVIVIAPSGMGAGGVLRLTSDPDTLVEDITLTERSVGSNIYDGTVTAPAGTYRGSLRWDGSGIGAVMEVTLSGVDPETVEILDKVLGSGGGGGSCGTGLYAVNISAQDTAANNLAGLRVNVLGTLIENVTRSDGKTFLNLDPGDYTLRYKAPAGFTDPPDELITVVDEDLPVNLVVDGTPLAPSEVGWLG